MKKIKQWLEYRSLKSIHERLWQWLWVLYILTGFCMGIIYSNIQALNYIQSVLAVWWYSVMWLPMTIAAALI